MHSDKRNGLIQTTAMGISNANCLYRIQVLTVGIVSILALSSGPSCALADGPSRAQFELIHWSHPQAPHYVPGLNFTRLAKLSSQISEERVAFVSRWMQERSRRNSTFFVRADTFVSPLTRVPGQYAMEIIIGTPAVKFSIQVDSGSDLVWLQGMCEPCSPDSGPAFSPEKSFTWKKMACDDPLCEHILVDCFEGDECQYEYEYQSGPTYGNMGYETIILTKSTGTKAAASHFALGCAYDVKINLAGTSGIAGLGQGPLSFTSQLGKVFNNKFSYCLLGLFDSSTSTSPLLFGDGAIPLGVVYSPMVQNPHHEFEHAETFYYLGLTGININRVLVNIPAGTFDIKADGTGGVILDSGSTISFLVTAAYRALLAGIQSACTYPKVPSSKVTYGFDLCYSTLGVANPTFPDVSLKLQGLSEPLELPSANVFVKVTANNYCLAFGDAGSLGVPFSIWGSFQQQNIHILFDRGAQRFGFAPVQCHTVTA